MDTGRTGGSPRGPALLLPGRGYGPHQPVLHYARRCLAEVGLEVRILEWPQAGAVADDVIRIVESAAEASGAAASDLVVVAKALGTHAIPWAASHGVRGIWITPLLQVAPVRQALPLLPPGSLLVGGTADPSWDGEIAAASGVPVLQIDGADHALEVPGDAMRSVAALARVVSAITGTLSPSVREDLTPLRGLPLR